MKRKDIHVPDGFDTVQGKLDTLEDSFDKLLEATDAFDPPGGDVGVVVLLADVIASVLVIQQVMIQQLTELLDE